MCKLPTIIIAIFSFFHICFTCPAFADHDPEVTIQLRWFHQFQFAGYYAALENGYYAEEGLNVKLLERNPKKDVVQSVLEGDADYGIDDTNLLKRRLEGAPVVQIAQIFQHSPLVLLTRRNSGINSPYQLQGKRVMMGDFDAPIRTMLESALGGITQIERIPHSYQLDEFLRGEVDAMSAYRTDQPFQLQQRGIETNIIDPRNYGVDFYGDNLFTTAAEVQTHPERVQRIVRATLRGWEYALANPEEIIGLILSRHKPSLDRDMLRHEARVVRDMIVPDLIPIGQIKPGRFALTLEFFARLNKALEPSLPDDFLYSVGWQPLIDVTEEERTWLGTRPTLKFSVDDQFAPFNYRDRNGQLTGISIEYIRLIMRKLGLPVEFVAAPWQDALKAATAYQTDGIISANISQERQTRLSFTEPYMISPYTLATLRDTPSPKSLSELSGRRIAVKKGTKAVIYLRNQVPAIEIVETKSLLEGLQMVVTGDVYGAFDHHAAIRYTIEENVFNDLKSALIHFDESIGNFRLGVRKDLPILLTLTNKAIAAISEVEHRKLRRRYLGEELVKPGSVELTLAEQRWLADHPTIRLGFSRDFEPFAISRVKQQPVGIIPDLIALLNERLGSRIELVLDDWTRVQERATNGNLDGIAAIWGQAANHLGFLTTNTHLHTYFGIFSRPGTLGEMEKGIDDLENKKVAIAKNSHFPKFLLTSSQSSMQIVETSTILEALQEVSEGSVDAALTLISSTYLARQGGISNVDLVHVIRSPILNGVTAIRPDLPELMTILNKAIASISDAEFNAIIERWSGKIQLPPFVRLSDEEQQWLQDNPVVRVGADPRFRPVEWFDRDGKLQGIARAYLNRLEQIPGLKFDIVPSGHWQQLIAKARAGELDMFSSVAATPERIKHLSFTEPYLTIPVMVFAKEGSGYISGLQKLEGKNVAVVDDYAVHEYLRRDWPQLRLVPVKNIAQGLDTVRKNRADAFIDALLTTSDELSRSGLTDIHVVGETDYTLRLGMGVRRDLPYLKSIIEKGLAQISEEERNLIYQQLVPIRYERTFDYSLLWKVGGTLLILLGLSLLWNHKLNQLRNHLAGQVQVQTRELRQSKEMLHSIVELTPDIIYRLDLAGRVVFVNQAIEKYGYRPEEIMGQNFLDLVHPDDRSVASNRIVERQAGDRRTRGLELRFQTVDGENRYFESLAQPITNSPYSLFEGEGLYDSDNSGRQSIIGTQGVLRDITARKQADEENAKLEQQIVQVQKLEAIGTLAGGIAHDFNNILSGIFGYAELTEMNLDDQEKAKKNLKGLRRASHRAKKLVAQILTFSRQSRHEVRPMQMNLVAKEVIKLMKATLPATIEIKSRINSDGTILADPTQIHQVLLNLCTNAAHAMRDSGGVLTVTLDKVHLDRTLVDRYEGVVPGPFLRLSVADTGQGIAPDIQDRLFEPFFTTKGLGEGTGMGLSVVHGIVHNCKGFIEVDSQPGSGAEFQIYFPQIISEEILDHDTEISVTGVMGNEHILFVDDETMQRDIATQGLKKLGYQVTTAADGESALFLFEKNPDFYNVVISDITMPGLSGDVLARRLLQIKPDLPIILCTGFSERINEHSAKAMGVGAFAYKPLAILELAGKIRELCSVDARA